MFVLMKSQTSLKLCHVGSKTRTLGRISEKPCVRSRGQIFIPIIIKLGQNVCLDEISDELKIGLVRSKTRSNLRKPCVRSRGHIFSPIIMNFRQNVCLDEIWDELENGSCWVKN